MQIEKNRLILKFANLPAYSNHQAIWQKLGPPHSPNPQSIG